MSWKIIFVKYFPQQKMREKIIETSLHHFLQHGIRKITIQKLVLALGISTKTMYKYFNNKEELLEECLKIHYSGTDKAIEELLQGSPNAVVSLCRVYSKSLELDFGTNHLFYHDLNHYYPDLQDKVIKQYTTNAVKILIAIIEQGVAEGNFQPHLQPPVVLQALSVLYTSITRFDTYKEFGLKPNDLIDHTINIYLKGICTDKGLQIVNQLTE